MTLRLCEVGTLPTSVAGRRPPCGRGGGWHGSHAQRSACTRGSEPCTPCSPRASHQCLHLLSWPSCCPPWPSSLAAPRLPPLPPAPGGMDTHAPGTRSPRPAPWGAQSSLHGALQPPRTVPVLPSDHPLSNTRLDSAADRPCDPGHPTSQSYISHTQTECPWAPSPRRWGPLEADTTTTARGKGQQGLFQNSQKRCGGGTKDPRSSGTTLMWGQEVG